MGAKTNIGHPTSPYPHPLVKTVAVHPCTFAPVMEVKEKLDTTEAVIDFFSCWTLVSESGRQIWQFNPPPTFSPEQHKEMLGQMRRRFRFDKSWNPNSADQVLRSMATDVSTTAEKNPEEVLHNGWAYFNQLQLSDGHWAGDYGGPMFLLPGLVIVAYITGISLPDTHRVLMAQYMLNHQNEDGGWGLHLEGASTMFGTCLQYVALRLLGEDASSLSMTKARNWIHTNGGATGVPPWGKFYLACLNVYEWEGCHALLPELWLLPKFIPIHPSKYWCHARMVFLPMSYCYGVKLKAAATPLIQSLRKELYTESYNEIDWVKARDKCAPQDVYHPVHPVMKYLNSVINTYEKAGLKSFRNKALDFVYRYICAEDKQTNYINLGPVNKVMNMLCVWHREGRSSEALQQHIAQIPDYLWVAEDGMKMQGYNGAQFWDTAFAVQAMQEVAADIELEEHYTRAVDFIRNQQVMEEPYQWNRFFRHASKGGFPFSIQQHGWPITDCTAEGIKILLSNHQCKNGDSKLDDAVKLLLSFQNADGGWASYEQTRAPEWIETLNPSCIFGNIMVDYSYTECTSSAVQALVKYHKAFPNRHASNILEAIQRGVSFILQQQLADGSWYGSWAVCFTYGTWFAIEALVVVRELKLMDEKVIAQSLERATKFLLAHQMDDGGWGEDFSSCIKKQYINSKEAQVVNTAWALMALMHCQSNAADIERGVRLLCGRQSANGDWPQEQISGVFNHNCMISYSNYRNIFPLWALGRFKKYKANSQRSNNKS